MKSLLLVAILFVTLLDQVEARCKKAPVSSAVIKKKLEAFTQMKKNDKGKWVPVADSLCWFDLTKNNCGTCKKGGKQCGYPMNKYCQSPKSKTVGLMMDSILMTIRNFRAVLEFLILSTPCQQRAAHVTGTLTSKGRHKKSLLIM